MKSFTIIGLALTIISLSSCTPTTPPPPPPLPLPVTQNNDVLRSESTGSIRIDMSQSYSYLDSAEKSYKSGSLKEILESHPRAVIYFYPKDGTPNCTIQALDFSVKKEEFSKLGYQIIGVSKDDLTSHKLFADRNELTIPLLQDGSGELMRSMGALGELKEYGNGSDKSDIIRSTFLVKNDGSPIAAFTDITAVGHADRIMDYIKSGK